LIHAPENSQILPDNPDYAPWTPPEGTVPFEHGQNDPGEFDWDAIHEDNDLELVLIRVPSSVS
jgi:hypothetical protein